MNAKVSTPPDRTVTAIRDGLAAFAGTRLEWALDKYGSTSQASTWLADANGLGLSYTINRKGLVEVGVKLGSPRAPRAHVWCAVAWQDGCGSIRTHVDIRDHGEGVQSAVEWAVTATRAVRGIAAEVEVALAVAAGVSPDDIG